MSLLPFNISWTAALVSAEGWTVELTDSFRSMDGLMEDLGTVTAGFVRIRLFFRAWSN